MNKKKIIIQFNEANFDLINLYVNKYNFINLKKVLNLPCKIVTSSEKEYNNLEPWIQWYSFYTNKSYDEHQVFHLGDSIKKNFKPFFEVANLDKVSIFGSMNIPFSKKIDVFIPDAWSELSPDKSISSRFVSSALKQIVNDNSKFKITFGSLFGLILLIGIPKSINDLKIALKSIQALFNKSRADLASLFDYYFFSYSMKRIAKMQNNLSMIFLNGLAHVQHHYMISSEFVPGSNPKWYAKKTDHLLNALKNYDYLFGKYKDKFYDDYEIWIITGLTQSPCKKPIYYWRLNDHNKFLANFFAFKFKVYPKMTRDFEIEILNSNDKEKVINFLKNAKIIDKNEESNAFGFIDTSSKNRVFSSLVYNGSGDECRLHYNEININFNKFINFIALKNGIHDQKGWVFSNNKFVNKDEIPIWEVSKLIV